VNLLAFDTATAATTVALAESASGETLERRDDPPPGARPRHTARLMPLIAELLAEAGWGFAKLDRIAVGLGPGTFTGLRIGVATARAIAQARDVELVGVSTLESLSLNADGNSDVDAVWAVLDARRREVFAAAWRNEGHEPLLAPVAIDPAALAERLETVSASALALGDGAIAFREVLKRSGASIPDDDADLHRVTAVNHCRLGLLADARDARPILPNYLRLPDAELARRSRINS
jgi:tRNA threonylcarbamoyladenosine biosynthesis protein TsaB